MPPRGDIDFGRLVQHFDTAEVLGEARIAEWPKPMDLRALADVEPAPPRFLIDDWLPAGYATLLAGHGGVGKSGIALGLAVALALGRPWFGLPVEPRRVLYLSCEDRSGLLHWRLSCIARHMGVGLRDLDGWLQVHDLVGQDTILWHPGVMQTGEDTPAMRALRARATHADVLMVDGVSDTFSGSENDRTQVKAYVNTVLSTVDPHEGAALLIGHVAKPAATGISTSEGYSGSTGWHNAVRARWYLYPETPRDDAGTERTGDLLLELQKSNLGRTDQSMRFSWSDESHLFVGQRVVAETTLDRESRERRERDGIEAAIRAIQKRGDYVPAAATGPRTAFHVLSEQSEMPDSLRASRADRARFWRHIEALRRMGIIREGSIRRSNGHRTATLELVGQQ